MIQEICYFAPEGRSRLTGLSKQCIFIVFFIFFLSPVIHAGSPAETARLVAAGLQAGNAAEVSKYFNTMVDLSAPGYDDTYSRAQAGQILKDFFGKNPVKSFKINKEGSSNDGSHYSIGELQAGQVTYRIYFLIKPVGGQNLVQQIQIQDKN